MKFLRLLACTLISGLVILTIVPASERPVTGVEHHYEHFLAFSFSGLIYALSYPRRLVILFTRGVGFALALELLQVPLPSRHARLGDFVVDALAGCGGMVVSYLSTKVWDVSST
jgi:VanZ family protein